MRYFIWTRLVHCRHTNGVRFCCKTHVFWRLFFFRHLKRFFNAGSGCFLFFLFLELAPQSARQKLSSTVFFPQILPIGGSVNGCLGVYTTSFPKSDVMGSRSPISHVCQEGLWNRVCSCASINLTMTNEHVCTRNTEQIWPGMTVAKGQMSS